MIDFLGLVFDINWANTVTFIVGSGLQQGAGSGHSSQVIRKSNLVPEVPLAFGRPADPNIR